MQKMLLQSQHQEKKYTTENCTVKKWKVLFEGNGKVTAFANSHDFIVSLEIFGGFFKAQLQVTKALLSLREIRNKEK